MPDPPGPPGKGGGKKILGMKPRTAMIAGIAVVGGSIGYMLWKRHQNASSASGSSSSASASSSAYGVDYAGQLSTLQDELENLMAADGAGASGGGSSGGGGITTGTTGNTGGTTVAGGGTATAVSASATTSTSPVTTATGGGGTTGTVSTIGTTGSTGTGAGSTTAAGTATVPGVVGDTQSVAFGKISAAGLKPKGSAVVAGKTLIVRTQSPGAGSKVARGSTVTLTSTVNAPTSTGTAATRTVAKPAMPANVRATKTTASSVTLSWTKVTGATSYTVRVTYQGAVVGGSHSVTGTSATVSGLTSDHTYTFHVAAVGPGGTSAETNGPAVKTSK